MAQPVTVYRWDDPGAPQIVEQRPSEIISLLKKCLIEGYGAKAPLGWSVLFEDPVTTKIIFKNSVAAGGSGGVLRVFTGNNGNSVRANTFFTPGQAATDIDNLYRPGYRHKFMLDFDIWNKWVLIGTATGFYLMIGQTGRVGHYDTVRDSIGFFGDFDSLIPNDAGRFIALINPRANGDASLVNDTSVWNSHFSQIWYASSSGWWSDTSALKIYDADSRDSSMVYNCLNVWGTSNSAPPLSRKQGVYTPLHLSLKASLAGATYTTNLDAAGVRLGDSAISPVWRGYLPGAIHEVFGRYSTQLWPIVEKLKNQDHFLLRSVTTTANCWINMVEW